MTGTLPAPWHFMITRRLYKTPRDLLRGLSQHFRHHRDTGTPNCHISMPWGMRCDDVAGRMLCCKPLPLPEGAHPSRNPPLVRPESRCLSLLRAPPVIAGTYTVPNLEISLPTKYQPRALSLISVSVARAARN